MSSDYFTNPYKIDWKWHSLFLILLFLGVVLFRSQGLIMMFIRPGLVAIAMLAMFHFFCRTAYALAERSQKTLKTTYPSFLLWLYPTIVLAELALFSFLLITISNRLWGRGFWSHFLELNGQETTRFFSTCFATMILFTALHFLKGTWAMLTWISHSSASRIHSLNQSGNSGTSLEQGLLKTISTIRAQTDLIQSERKRATRFNRIALFLVFMILLAGGCWIVFFRPAIVLYYRAEIQLRTFVQPQAAYATFQHLKEKFPKYRYLDTVSYRMAWILDRRLGKFDEAAKAYREFIEKYSPKSVWSDEALVSIVRIYQDKLNRSKDSLHWINEYLKHFSDGIMAPHMYLYKIRAFARLRQFDQANACIERAKKLFSGKQIQIINSEDRLAEIVSFDDALNAEISAMAKLQQSF
jgi:tetratricopeptide (TPR) repeat protein